MLGTFIYYRTFTLNLEIWVELYSQQHVKEFTFTTRILFVINIVDLSIIIEVTINGKL